MRSDILRAFGPDGIVGYAPAYGGIGRITDDTQMTLFTAEGLIRAWVRKGERGITTYEGVTANAYLRWLRTQGYKPHRDIEYGPRERVGCSSRRHCTPGAHRGRRASRR